MKISFVNAFITYNKNSFPIGLVSLCTILKQNSIESQIIDFSELCNDGIIPQEKYGVCAGTQSPTNGIGFQVKVLPWHFVFVV